MSPAGPILTATPGQFSSRLGEGRAVQPRGVRTVVPGAGDPGCSRCGQGGQRGADADVVPAHERTGRAPAVVLCELLPQPRLSPGEPHSSIAVSRPRELRATPAPEARPIRDRGAVTSQDCRGPPSAVPRLMAARDLSSDATGYRLRLPTLSGCLQDLSPPSWSIAHFLWPALAPVGFVAFSTNCANSMGEAC